MRCADVVLAERAASRHGIVTAADAAASGLTTRQVQLRVGAGILLPVHRGVYRHAATAETRATATMAAVYACGVRAVASHRSAGRLWGLRDVPRWRPEVTVPGRVRPGVTGVVLHRTDRLDDVDRALCDSVPVTTVARTLLDLGSILPPPALATSAEDAVIRGLVTPVELVCTLERLGGRGRRGAAALRAAVRTMADCGPLESRLEHDLLRLIRSTGVPAPLVQHEAVLPGPLHVRFDFAWPHRRVAVEADGRRWHATSAEFARDLERHNAVTAGGWRLYRFGWADVHQRADQTTDVLRAALHRVGAA